MREIFIFCT